MSKTIQNKNSRFNVAKLFKGVGGLLVLGFIAIFVIGFSTLIYSVVSPKSTPDKPYPVTHQPVPDYKKLAQQGSIVGPPNLGTNTTGDEHPCVGNEQDTCIGAPSIDFYPGGTEDASNPDYKGDVGRGKEIMGRITAHNGKSIAVKTSSGRTFTIEFPVDPIETFNTQRSSNYQNMLVTTGDMIYAWYSEKIDQADTTVRSSQMYRSNLIIKPAQDLKSNPDAPIVKY